MPSYQPTIATRPTQTMNGSSVYRVKLDSLPSRLQNCALRFSLRRSCARAFGLHSKTSLPPSRSRSTKSNAQSVCVDKLDLRRIIAEWHHPNHCLVPTANVYTRRLQRLASLAQCFTTKPSTNNLRTNSPNHTAIESSNLKPKTRSSDRHLVRLRHHLLTPRQKAACQIRLCAQHQTLTTDA